MGYRYKFAPLNDNAYDYILTAGLRINYSCVTITERRVLQTMPTVGCRARSSPAGLRGRTTVTATGAVSAGRRASTSPWSTTPTPTPTRPCRRRRSASRRTGTRRSSARRSGDACWVWRRASCVRSATRSAACTAPSYSTTRCSVYRASCEPTTAAAVRRRGRAERGGATRPRCPPPPPPPPSPRRPPCPPHARTRTSSRTISRTGATPTRRWRATTRWATRSRGTWRTWSAAPARAATPPPPPQPTPPSPPQSCRPSPSPSPSPSHRRPSRLWQCRTYSAWTRRWRAVIWRRTNDWCSAKWTRCSVTSWKSSRPAPEVHSARCRTSVYLSRQTTMGSVTVQPVGRLRWSQWLWRQSVGRLRWSQWLETVNRQTTMVSVIVETVSRQTTMVSVIVETVSSQITMVSVTVQPVGRLRWSQWLWRQSGKADYDGLSDCGDSQERQTTTVSVTVETVSRQITMVDYDSIRQVVELGSCYTVLIALKSAILYCKQSSCRHHAGHRSWPTCEHEAYLHGCNNNNDNM